MEQVAETLKGTTYMETCRYLNHLAWDAGRRITNQARGVATNYQEKVNEKPDL